MSLASLVKVVTIKFFPERRFVTSVLVDFTVRLVSFFKALILAFTYSATSLTFNLNWSSLQCIIRKAPNWWNTTWVNTRITFCSWTFVSSTGVKNQYHVLTMRRARPGVWNQEIHVQLCMRGVGRLVYCVLTWQWSHSLRTVIEVNRIIVLGPTTRVRNQL